MKQLAPLEDAIAKVHKDLPHLPKGLTTWLVDNAWWLVTIGVVLGALGALTMLPAIMVGSSVAMYYAGGAYGSSLLVTGLASLAVLVAVVVIQATAIAPLKAKKKRGWNLLFLASLVGIVGSLIGSFISYNFVGGIVTAVIAAAISFYVLFELRGHYVGSKQKPVEAKKA